LFTDLLFYFIDIPTSPPAPSPTSPQPSPISPQPSPSGEGVREGVREGQSHWASAAFLILY